MKLSFRIAGRIFLLSLISVQPSLGQTAAGQIDTEPFRYIPPVATPDANAVEIDEAKASPAQKRVIAAIRAGDYRAAGELGLSLIAGETVSLELKLMIANSLAWSGKTRQATPIYELLFDSKLKVPAMVGKANILRWQGKSAPAKSLYSNALKEDKNNQDAKEGLRLVGRELRSRAKISNTSGRDSSDVHLRGLIMNLRWFDQKEEGSYEIEASLSRSKQSWADESSRDVVVRYSNPKMKYEPRVEISSNGQSLFGLASLTPVEDFPLTVHVGRVDWSKMSGSPSAIRNNHTALRFGLQSSLELSSGQLNLRAESYRVSDGNLILASTGRFNSSWRPLGALFQPFIGIETRKAKRGASDYWTPVDGYGAIYAGFTSEHAEADWNIFGSVQLGTRLWGEAGRNWGISAGAKRWFNDDLAVSASFWALGSRRGTQGYRASSLNFNVEKYWE